MISEAAVLWGLNIYAIIGIIFFILIGFMANFFSKDRAKEDPVQQTEQQSNQNQYEDDEKKALVAQGLLFEEMRGGHHHHNQYKVLFTNQSIIDQIHNIADIYFIRQSTFMIGFALGAWLIFFASFSAQFSVFWSLISLIYGLIVVALVGFIALKMSINVAIRFLNESLYSRGKAYSFGWGAGAAISAGIVCLVLFIFNDLVSLSQHFMFKKEEHYSDQDKQLGYYFTLMGFVWGIFSGVFFYRQMGVEVGKGLTNGSDMLGSERIDHIFDIQHTNDEIIQQGKIFGNIISSTLTSFLDYVGILSLLVVIFGIIISQSKEIVQTGEQGIYYFPSYAILLCALFQIILTILAYIKRGVEDSDQVVTPATFTAKNNILQVILCKVTSALVLIFIPLYFFPNEEFSIGSSDYPAFHYDKITSYSLVWCAEIGLITQGIMIFIGELFTSNAFRSTKEVALEQMKNPGYGQNQVFTMCSFAQGFILISLGISVMLCYLFGGFLGIAAGLVGILSTPILLGTITIFGTCSQDGAILARLSQLSSQSYYNCRNMAKGAMNYLIYMQITTAVAVFFIDIVLIGLTGYLGKIKEVEIWDTFTLLGLFLGGAMAYMLKASSNNTISDIAKPIGKGQLLPEDFEQDEDFKYDQHSLEYKATTFKNYILTKIASKPIIKTIINLVGCFSLILILAYLFGGKVVLGYVTGLNLFGVHLVLYSILLSNAAKNARHFNQDVQLNKDHHQRNISGLQNSIICDVATSTCENNGILAYLLINSLFVMMGALQFWQTWGRFGKYLEGDRQDITEITTSFWDWFVVGSDSE